MPDLTDLIRANVKQAQHHARAILSDPRTVILDTETTGLHSAFVVDLAVIERGNTLIDTLVNPGVRIPKDATAIHGITNKMVRNAPPFADIWPELHKILAERRVVIYNARYDLGIIRAEMFRLGIETANPFNVEVEDAMTLYQRWYFGGVGRSSRHQTRLVDPHCDAPQCQRDSVRHRKAAHRARADCIATAKRLKMIAETCWIDDHYRNPDRREVPYA